MTTSQAARLQRERILGLARRLVQVVLACGVMAARVDGQEVRVWEFSPYKVRALYAYGNDLPLDTRARQSFERQLATELKRTYRAAWNLEGSAVVPEWTRTIESQFPTFQVADLGRSELQLVVSLKHDQTRTIRTMDAALENLAELWVTAQSETAVMNAVERLSEDQRSNMQALTDKLSIDAGGLADIKSKLVGGEIACALLPKAECADISESIRQLITPLPWQTDSLLQEHDKLLFVYVSHTGEQLEVAVRELDCPMQFMGPVFTASTSHWTHASRIASHCCKLAFAPIARVEEADATTGKLRHRAGGLIINPENPARIRVGDVLQPIVRRDDRNGVPTLLQPLSWTFAAVTASDGVRMDANVYTYSGGPGLQGRRNRRTRRVLLRVRPNVELTDVRIVTRGPKVPQAGCFVYSKDFLTDQFDLLGRTDWRGQLRLETTESPRILEASVKRERLAAKREALAKAAQAAAQGAAAEAPPEAESESAADILAIDPANDPEAIPLNYPLMQLYVKNGDTVLAKLPFVPGLNAEEIAELPDDRRRLETEAFVKGFQGEIIDVIGLRNLLAAQIQLKLKDKKVDEAQSILAQMRQLPTYNEMADQLEVIQSEMLDESRGAISLGEKRRIDRMFQTTRNMLQKYMQDNLLRDAESAVSQATGGQESA